MVKVKICGVTTKEDASIAVNAGADAIGIIVGESRSPRSVTVRKAGRIMRSLPPFVTGVVVTPYHSVDQLIEIKGIVNPDVIQLQDDLPLNSLGQVAERLKGVKLVGVLALKKNSEFDEVLPKIRSIEKVVDAIHLDSRASNGRIGGSGNTHNWKLSRTIRDAIYPKPTILAGGLTPDNVVGAIKMVRPWGVDVATGVENTKTRKKSSSLVSEFIRAVKEGRW